MLTIAAAALGQPGAVEGPGERLIAEALHPNPDGLVIVTKGLTHPPDRWGHQGGPRAREAVEGAFGGCGCGQGAPAWPLSLPHRPPTAGNLGHLAGVSSAPQGQAHGRQAPEEVPRGRNRS
jgi:hypothetical protein